MQRWERDMGAREGGKSWMRGEERDNVVGGGGGRVANGREREGRESTQRTEGTGRGALWRSLPRPRACSGPLQATARNRALFFFCFPSSSSAPLLSEKRERFLRGKFTAGHRAGRGSGSSPEMNRGGSFRRRLSSLRGAWRWSTGYLFRKVGCDEWWIWLKAALVASSLSTLNVFFFFVIEKVFVSFADFYKPPTSFPSPPSSLTASLFLRWLICMACL